MCDTEKNAVRINDTDKTFKEEVRDLMIRVMLSEKSTLPTPGELNDFIKECCTTSRFRNMLTEIFEHDYSDVISTDSVYLEYNNNDLCNIYMHN